MKLDSQRILAGSLNILTPSDKTPENDAIVLQNIRVDQADVLRAADAVTQILNLGAPLHSIFKFNDMFLTQAYGVGNTTVSWGSGAGAANIDGAFLLGAGTNLTFYWPGGAGGSGITTLLATNFSGNVLSIGLWNSFLWVLDNLQQVKINPALLYASGTGGPSLALSAVTRWLPDVPYNPPGVTPFTATPNVSGGGSLSGSYVYYCTYCVLSSGGFMEEGPGSPGVTLTAAGGAISLTSIPFSAGVVDYNSATTSYPLAAIRIYRAPAGTPFYLGIATANPAVLFLKQFGIGDSPIPDPVHGGYIQCTEPLVSTYPASDDPWVDTGPITSQIGPLPVTAYTLLTPSGFPIAPLSGLTGVGGYDVASSSGAVGTYTYYRTYVNSAGLETNPSAPSNSVTPSNGKIDLVWPTPPTNQDIVRQRLYRLGGTQAAAYQVIEFADATTTSYTDGAPDVVLTENDIVMPTTNNPPPSGVVSDSMGFVGPYFNYLLAWKNGRMFWSQNGVALFPGSDDSETVGNWVNVGRSDDKILEITLHPQMACIYKQRTVWRLYGDPVSGSLVNSSATCGAAGKAAVSNCGSYDLYLADDGVYTFTGEADAPVSEKIAPVFMGKQWINLGASDLAQPYWGTPNYPFVAFVNGTAILGNGGSALQPYNGVGFLFHPATQRWASFPSNWTAVLPYGNRYRYFAGDVFGNFFVSKQTTDDNLPMIWQTRFLDQGLGDTPKFYQEIVIDAELNGATMTVWLLFNNTANAPALATILPPYTAIFNGTSRQKFYMPLPQDEGDTGAYHISVRVSISGSLSNAIPPAIHALYIYWATEERDASTRGTQVLDYRAERIQLCQRMEVDCVGQVDLAIWTDEPNGLALRYTFHGPAQGRAIYEFKLPPNVRGRLWRVDVLPKTELNSDAPGFARARVYAVRGWMRQVGTSDNETWQWKDFIRGVDAELPDAE